VNLGNQPGGMLGLGYIGAPNIDVDDGAPSIDEMRDAMIALDDACRDYRRDFQRWPSDVEALRGNYLPQDYTPTVGVTLHLPPAGTTIDPARWILASSDPLLEDLEGKPLARPHKLILRPGAKPELLLADEVEAAIALQRADSPTEQP